MRTPVLIFIILLSVACVSAVNVTLIPQAIYETTSSWEALDVNNYRGSSVVSRVAVGSPLRISDAQNYSGWTRTLNAYSVEWKDGSVETNVRSAWFEFLITAPDVADDTVVTFNVSLDSSVRRLNFTILNDPTPPVIDSLRPSEYARANNPMQAISAVVYDEETSVSSVRYTWNDCDGSPDITSSLIASNNTYNGVANFSDFDEGDSVCYVLRAVNAPGDTSELSGVLLFDGTAPSVNISAPTSYATELTDFVFSASDNIASVLSCEISLDSTELSVVNVSNGSTAVVTENLSGFTQGTHTWTVVCQDGVGLTATRSQVIQLDTAPPVIQLDAPATLPRTQSVQISAEVTDTVGLASVSATFDGDNLTLTQSGDDFTASISSDVLGEKYLVITATDAAGHVTVVNHSVTIVPNHLLTLSLSPASATPGSTVAASGTLTAEGSLDVDSVLVRTPDGDFNVELSGDDYSRTFIAPAAGTYVISAEFVDSGHTYRAQATLSVYSAQSGSSNDGSHGYDSSWSGGAGYVKPKEEAGSPESDDGEASSSELTTEEPVIPEPEYEPLPPVEPRDAQLAPKATGVFDLGSSVKWFALLLALALVVGLGVYAYSKRKPKDDGIDWEGYFKGGA